LSSWRLFLVGALVQDEGHVLQTSRECRREKASAFRDFRRTDKSGNRPPWLVWTWRSNLIWELIVFLCRQKGSRRTNVFIWTKNMCMNCYHLFIHLFSIVSGSLVADQKIIIKISKFRLEINYHLLRPYEVFIDP